MAHTRTGAVQLFPRPKVERPSNNVQPVFSPPNPFLTRAQAGPLTRTRREVRRTADGGSRGFTDDPGGSMDIIPVPSPVEALQALREGRPVEARRSLRLGAGLPAEEELGVLEGSLAEAAKLVSRSVATNPFITPDAKEKLAQGRLPLLGDISPAFYRHTSPSIVQALQGLFLGTGLFTPEDLEFARTSALPASFR